MGSGQVVRSVGGDHGQTLIGGAADEKAERSFVEPSAQWRSSITSSTGARMPRRPNMSSISS